MESAYSVLSIRYSDLVVAFLFRNLWLSLSLSLCVNSLALFSYLCRVSGSLLVGLMGPRVLMLDVLEWSTDQIALVVTTV